MKIGDLARVTGLSPHTIRYYERIGLMPRAPRGGSGQRGYDTSILPWIEFLGRLKTTGMPVREMARYTALRAKGSSTEPARKELLRLHRERVAAHVAALQACLAVLDAKIAGYGNPHITENTNDADRTPSRQPLRKRPARAS